MKFEVGKYYLTDTTMYSTGKKEIYKCVKRTDSMVWFVRSTYADGVFHDGWKEVRRKPFFERYSSSEFAIVQKGHSTNVRGYWTRDLKVYAKDMFSEKDYQKKSNELPFGL